MRKPLSLLTIAFYLILSLVLSHVHNHSILEGENDSCPAYIIGISVSADQVPAIEAEPTVLRVVQTVTLFEGIFTPQNVITPFRRRGPPLFA
jgi:hypothetical protein